MQWPTTPILRTTILATTMRRSKIPSGSPSGIITARNAGRMASREVNPGVHAVRTTCGGIGSTFNKLRGRSHSNFCTLIVGRIVTVTETMINIGKGLCRVGMHRVNQWDYLVVRLNPRLVGPLHCIQERVCSRCETKCLRGQSRLAIGYLHTLWQGEVN